MRHENRFLLFGTAVFEFFQWFVWFLLSAQVFRYNLTQQFWLLSLIIYVHVQFFSTAIQRAIRELIAIQPFFIMAVFNVVGVVVATRPP